MVPTENKDASMDTESRLRAASNELKRVQTRAYRDARAIVDQTVRAETKKLHEKFPTILVTIVVDEDHTVANIDRLLLACLEPADLEVYRLMAWLSNEVADAQVPLPLAITVLPETPLESTEHVNWTEKMRDPTRYVLGLNQTDEDPVFVTGADDDVAWKIVRFQDPSTEQDIKNMLRSTRLYGRA